MTTPRPTLLTLWKAVVCVGAAACLLLAVPVVDGWTVLQETKPAQESTRADDSGSKPPPKAKAKKARANRKKAKKGQQPAGPIATADAKSRREALAIMRDLQQLTDAVLDDQGGSAAAKAPAVDAFTSLLAKLGRPTRSVEPPTLTPGEIDRMIDAHLKDAEVNVAKLCGDETFLRRVSYDLTGKPPAPERVASFVASRDPNKRAKLIDELLESPDYAQNWARYWRDVIIYHATNNNVRRMNLGEFETWLAEQLQKNRPWDEVVSEIITARGGSDENGATAMYLAHFNQRFEPVEMAGEVSRVFMGVQIACAQCHDHPTDSWKREQFHELAAFFGGAVVRPNRQVRPPTFTVDDRPRALYRMPDLKDPQKQTPVRPKFFLAASVAEIPPGLNSQQLRALAASYITGQDNPWFAKAYVNRIWYALTGEGFYNPIDDIGPEREPQAPEVLEALATAWTKGGYDVKWLFRTIMNTRAYQRQVRSTRTTSGRTPFAANCPSRLRADQVVDALVQVLELPLDRRNTRPAAGTPKAADAAKSAESPSRSASTSAESKPMPMPAARANAARNQFLNLFGFDPSLPNEEIMGTTPQALFLINGDLVARGTQARPGTLLGRLLREYPDNRAALEALYLKVLARRPSAEEVRTCAAYLSQVGNRQEAFEDILWALINSTEFLSRR